MLLKIIRDVKNEELGKDFFMWEKDNNRSTCRYCQSAFSTFRRRHHCRLCGGLYCEACTTSNFTFQGVTHDRACCGCVRKETPGARIRSSVESRVSSGLTSIAERNFSLNLLQLEYGSPFEPGSSASKADAIPPKEGYFELINKSSTFCAVKLMKGGTKNEFESSWEIARPSYTALPPNELLQVRFASESNDTQPLELFVLYANSNIIPGDVSSVTFDTKNNSDISPCASIENFWQYVVYRIDAASKNVLLKFKGEGVVEIRLGSSIERNGIFGKLTGSSTKDSSLDFSTNIPASAMSRII